MPEGFSYSHCIKSELTSTSSAMKPVSLPQPIPCTEKELICADKLNVIVKNIINNNILFILCKF